MAALGAGHRLIEPLGRLGLEDEADALASARLVRSRTPGEKSASRTLGGKLSWIAQTTGIPSSAAASAPVTVQAVAVLSRAASKPRPCDQETSSSTRPMWELVSS